MRRRRATQCSAERLAGAVAKCCADVKVK